VTRRRLAALLVLLLLVSISSAVALSRGGSETNKPDSTVACREDTFNYGDACPGGGRRAADTGGQGGTDCRYESDTFNYGDACAVESDRTDPK
jgi:hypothetical protein